MIAHYQLKLDYIAINLKNIKKHGQSNIIDYFFIGKDIKTSL